jgi:two-component system, OmpR family, sensor kinase
VISIRRRLLAILLGVIATALLAGAFGTYRLSRREVDRLFDYQLEQIALSLRDQAFSSAYSPLPPEGDEFHFVVQAWAADGSRVYVSHPQTDLPSQTQRGLSTTETADERWRTYSTQQRDHIIQVAQPMSVREHLATAAALRTVQPLLLSLPVLGLLIWWLIGRGLAPLLRIANSVGRRTANSLDPLRLEGVPSEARPLVESINQLLKRLDAALVSQRAFVADAAHELRTPLTALQLQAQLTERAESADARQAAIGELKLGLQRAGHVVHQLLTLARQDPADLPTKPHEPVALADLVAVVVADHTKLAEAKQIDLGVSESDPVAIIPGDYEALRTLVGNLIDNAIRYTPWQGRIDAAVRCRAGRCLLEIGDSGPGVPAEDRERVFDRFFRRAGNEEPGSGLGLAIVKAIALRHGATVTLATSALGGLSVQIGFPATAV